MGTNTTNLNLYKPAVGETGWGTLVDGNFDTLDHGQPDVLYVSPNGSDARSGLTWGAAKQYIMSAYDALPATGGTIYIASGSQADPTAGIGIWLAGSQDPNYASLPTGWRRRKTCRFIGVTRNEETTGTRLGGAAFIISGSGTVRWNAAIRIIGGGGSLHFRNLQSKYPLRNVIIGVNSNNAKIVGNSDTVQWSFKNCHFLLQQNPSAEVPGPNFEYFSGYWVSVDNCIFSNPGYAQTPSSVANTAGTTYRVTVPKAHEMVVGETVQLFDFIPSGYNGIWKITNVNSTTSYDVDLGTNPAAVSVMGRGVPHEAAVRAGFWNSGGHYLKIEDSTFNGGNILHDLHEYQGGLHYLHNDMEGGGWGASTIEPALYHFRDDLRGGAGFTGGDILVQGLQTSDGEWTRGEVRNESTLLKSGLTVVGDATKVIGPAVVLGSTRDVYREGASTPASQQQSGFWQGRVVGVHMGHRRWGGPSAVRYANLAAQDTSTWSSKTGSATVTTGKTDPFGLVNAAELTSASGTDSRAAYRNNTATALGDFYIAGVWCRPTGDAASGPLVISSNASGTRFNGAASGTQVQAQYPTLSAGNWEWLFVVGKITILAASPVDFSMDMRCHQTSPMQFAYPTLLHVAAGTITDSEAWELGYAMGHWPDTASVGQVAFVRDQSLHIPRGYIEIGNMTAPGAPTASSGLARLYIDTSAGKQRVMAQFDSGAAVVIATEP